MSKLEQEEIRKIVDGENAGGGSTEPDDDESKEKCYQRWKGEDHECLQWEPKWRGACQERASERRYLCYKQGYPNPASPAEWGVDDMETGYNPGR